MRAVHCRSLFVPLLSSGKRRFETNADGRKRHFLLPARPETLRRSVAERFGLFAQVENAGKVDRAVVCKSPSTLTD